MPFWALTELYGRSPMYWYRLERSLGRFSVVGTTVQAADHLPRHLVADEKHTTLIQKKTRKVYLATTVGGGCCLGMALAETAGADDLASGDQPLSVGRRNEIQFVLDGQDRII